MVKFLDGVSSRWNRRLYATDRARDFDHEHDRNVRIRQIYQSIDRQPYQWVVVIVAGVGFFLDGYTLFVSNIALPMLAYVYWRDETSVLPQTRINIATLAGTLIGQVLFGVLADKFGRKKMYGFELVVVILATLGVVMSSNGADNSMSVFAWIIWWRIVAGIGVGADYPLSAVITSEFAPTPKRARMLASVFFMQPLGQICGNLVSIVTIIGFRNNDTTDLTKSIDRMWRLIIGIGVVPGVIALFFRIVIPETPRFIAEIEEDPVKAEFDATQLFGELPRDLDLETLSRNNSLAISQRADSLPGPSTPYANPQAIPGAQRLSTITDKSQNATSTNDIPRQPPSDLNSTNSLRSVTWRFSKADVRQYFWVEGNWRTLFATSVSWLLLDFGFYGISLSSPQFLAKTWGTLKVKPSSPSWMTDTTPGVSVYDMFLDTSVHALIILNLGAFVGSILLIVFSNKVNRVSLQKYGFLVLAAIFIALGVAFIVLERTGVWTIVLYVIAELAFNFGPNGTTYMLPAEMFPARYRATCHGISAGTGKLGSILIQIFAAYYDFGSSKLNGPDTKKYGIILIVLSAAMILGSAVTHVWMPQVQDSKLRSKPLEVLAMGRNGENNLKVKWLRSRIQRW